MSVTLEQGTTPTGDAASVFAGGGEMGRLCLATDWAATPLGPVDGWPPSLKTVVTLVLRSGFPMTVVWGPERIQIYNDGYAPLLGDGHPRALAAPAYDTWPEIRDVQEPIFRRVFAGETVTLAAARHPLRRGGAVEELYLDATFVPIADGTGAAGGCVGTVLDVTERMAAPGLQAERERLLTSVQAARAEAEASARGLAGVLDRITDAHVVLDREFRFTRVTPAAERALGKPRAELLGRTHWEVFPASYDADAGRAYRQVAAAGVPVHLVQHYRWEGYDTHLEIDAYPTDEGGVAIFWRDITERVRLEGERERFRRFVEQASEAHAVFDAEGRIVWSNPVMGERLGYTAEELAALAITDVDPHFPPSRFRELFERARRERVPPFDSAHRRRDGTIVPVEVAVTLVELAEGGRLFSSARDIPERKRAEAERERLIAAERAARAEAERSAQVTSKITTHLAEGVCMMDAEGRLTYMNPAAERILGWTREEIEGRVLHDAVHYLHPDGRPYAISDCPLGRVLSAGEPVLGLVDQWIRKDGTFVHVVTTCAPLVSDGRVTGAVLSLHDDTQRRRAEAERERLLRDAELAQVEAEAANRAKADFLASMSHELRTPLNAIGGYVGLMEMEIQGPITDRQRDALTRITANQRHLLRLINDILAFAKLEAGQIVYDLHPLSACDLLAGVEPLVAPMAEAKGVGYDVLPCDPAMRLMGDEERVRQVLLNLVTNAIKFTPAGGWTRLFCDADDGWVRVRVRDNGPGISVEKQQAIFDPFIQVDRRLDRPQEGVGLGLAISRDLARGMGGELSVESGPGEGSTFTLHLPRLPDAPADG